MCNIRGHLLISPTSFEFILQASESTFAWLSAMLVCFSCFPFPKYMFFANMFCFYCTWNIIWINPIEGPELRMNEWQGLLLLLTSEWPEASPTFPRGKWCIIMSNQAPRNIQLHVFNADQRRESGGFLRERELCQSDKLSIVVLKNCLAILHRLVLTIYALLKMVSFNF